MVSFENFVKSMLPSLSESKVTSRFCFPFKIRDNPTATSRYVVPTGTNFTLFDFLQVPKMLLRREPL